MPVTASSRLILHEGTFLGLGLFTFKPIPLVVSVPADFAPQKCTFSLQNKDDLQFRAGEDATQ